MCFLSCTVKRVVLEVKEWLQCFENSSGITSGSKILWRGKDWPGTISSESFVIFEKNSCNEIIFVCASSINVMRLLFLWRQKHSVSHTSAKYANRTLNIFFKTGECFETSSQKQKVNTVNSIDPATWDFPFLSRASYKLPSRKLTRTYL